MTRHERARAVENLCAVSQDIGRRILTCERRGRDGARVDYDDLVMWFDVLGDAISLIREEDQGARDVR